MIWFKSAIVGLAAAVITVVAIIVATSVAVVNMNGGSGSIGAVSFGVTALLLFPAALAFALGFRWMFRRQRLASTPSRRVAGVAKDS